jgi:hypothetical protein
MHNALRIWICGLLLAFAAIANATTVIPLYLDELIDQSTVAFEGTCIANRTELDPATHLVVTYTTFEVRDVLKGTVGATHTIKQVGGTLAGGEESGSFKIRGIPTFAVGGDYVVFLAGVSDAGFSSPIGLSQGRFTVSGPAGARRVANGRDFKDMTSRMAQRLPQTALEKMQAAPGASMNMGLADFKQAVRGHVGAMKCTPAFASSPSASASPHPARSRAARSPSARAARRRCATTRRARAPRPSR